MNTVEISIVIIEYFSVGEIADSIRSITKSCQHISHEIIISSNSCYPSDKQDQLKQLYPTARWSFNERNGGFAYGMNQGLKIAQGRYLIIMNPDVAILHGLTEMISFMNDNEQVGAVGPQIIDNQGAIQDSCRSYVSLTGFLYRTIKRIAKKTDSVLTPHFDYSKIQTVDWIIGAFILIRRKAFEATGGLDDHYFMYAEDLDWCTRIRQSGFEVAYFPLMQVEYVGSRAARKSTKYAKIFMQSHLRYWWKFGFFFGYPKRKNLEFNN